MATLITLQQLSRSLKEHKERPALLAFGRGEISCWDYAGLSREVLRLAQGLIDQGIGRGDSVMLLAPNSPAWIITCLAILRAGAVVIPLDSQLGRDSFRHILEDSEAKLLFTTGEKYDRFSYSLREAENFPIYFLDKENNGSSWRRLFCDTSTAIPEVSPDETAALFYTSGTTGPPKGVPLTHRNLICQINAIRDIGFLRDEDRILLPLPLHHVYPFAIGMLTPLALGLCLILPRSLTAVELLRAIRDGDTTVIIGVPRLYRALFSGIDSHVRKAGKIAALLFQGILRFSTFLRQRLRLSLGKKLFSSLHGQFGPSLRILASGGSPLDPGLARRLEGLGWDIAIGYGLTETSPLLTINLPRSGRLDSVGRPLPGIDIRIDTAALPGEVVEVSERSLKNGEILVKGPNVFNGYRKLPEKTEKSFTRDGWFRTGDIGHLDHDKWLIVSGRVSTLIVTEAGENVEPENVEAAYQDEPVIREIGILEKDGRLAAVIVPEISEIKKLDEDADLREVIRRSIEERSRKLPSFQRLSDFVITRNPIQRTELGKIRRHLLPGQFEYAKKAIEQRERRQAGPISVDEMSEADLDLITDPDAAKVWHWLAERFPEERLAPDTSPQLDLGVDSLEWLNISMEIRQRVGVELNEEALGRIDTVRDLLQEVVRQTEEGEVLPRAEPLEKPGDILSKEQKKWLRPLGPIMIMLGGLFYGMVWIIMRGYFRLEVKNFENLPEEGPFIITPNHVSYLDAFALGAAIGFRRLRDMYWAGWIGAAFSNPVTRFASRLGQAVPIDPNRRIISSLAFGAEVLRRGKNLIWFPEGRRSPSAKLLPFKSGVGYLLHYFSISAVPVFISGSEHAMPIGRAFPRPHRITVTFGSPVAEGELAEKGEGHEPQDRIVNGLRGIIAELGGRERGTSPDEVMAE